MIDTQDVNLWFICIGLLLYYFIYVNAEKEPDYYGKWPEVVGWLDFGALVWWILVTGTWALAVAAFVYFLVLIENTIARNPDL